MKLLPVRALFLISVKIFLIIKQKRWNEVIFRSTPSALRHHKLFNIGIN